MPSTAPNAHQLDNAKFMACIHRAPFGCSKLPDVWDCGSDDNGTSSSSERNRVSEGNKASLRSAPHCAPHEG